LIILTFDEIDPINESIRDSDSETVRESVRKQADIQSYYELLCDKEKIQTLAKDGKQPFMEVLSKHFRVIYIKEETNFFQDEYIVNFVYK
jgi:hypothetical protein